MLDSLTEIVGNVIGTIFPSRSASVLKKLLPRVEQINVLEPKIAKLTDREMREKTNEFRAKIAEIRAGDPDAIKTLKVEKYLDEILAEAFALVREAGKRSLGMRHFDVQLVGGMVLHGMASPLKEAQNRGMISEMVTGEGKTLVATLPSYLNALQRLDDEYAYVHVVTVNDYLAKRDSDWNRPLFELLGMKCGAIQSQMDSFERHEIYSRDIVYGTNSEFGFDYLRDNMKMEPEKQCQKVRHYGIIDEVDSILIDEARTPLIISGGAEDELTERYRIAAELAAHLKPTTLEEQFRIEDLRIHGQFEEPKDGDYMVDEKDHTVTLTARGIHECEKYLKIDNFYTGKHMDWPRYIDNALKAKELYKKDDKYGIFETKDRHTGGTKLEVVIVDEQTGRPMYGRRWSDGLHQAVEAKEILAGEKISMEAETHTLATVTIQNFFKMYKKLAGMTGTAVTESREFGQIYKLEVCSIPTNRPMRRLNYPDVIYGSEKEKWEAICQEIEDVHATGRPVLVGTTSVEKSEVLAGMLERRGFREKVDFNLLNAKQHAREALIIEVAGKLGAITVATNMAGRGTDIVLGRFSHADLVAHWQALKLLPEKFDLSRPREEIDEHLIGVFLKQYDKELFDKTPQEERKKALEKWWREHNQSPLKLAESVKELGGLHIIGSERHEARRIDNQLRGRSGRQGDPGSSRFFLSLDDDLMRIFAKDWVRNFLKASGMKDGVPLESRMVSRSIEKAQRRVEEHHFGTRKRLLEYDEVMNEQRKLIYGLRQKVLESRELRETMQSWLEDVVALAVERECVENPPPPESLMKLADWARRKFGVELTTTELSGKSPDEIEDLVIARVKAAYEEKDKALGEMETPKDKALRYSEAELKQPIEALSEMARWRAAEAIGEGAKVDAISTTDIRARVEGLVFANLRALRAKDEKFVSALDAVRAKGFEYGPSELNLTIEAMAKVICGKIAAEMKVDAKTVEVDLDYITSNALPSVITVPQKERQMRLIERFLLLDIIDSKWKDHLQTMDSLREGIYLRSYAQKDPKLEYKREGFDAFQEMFTSMKEQTTDMILKMQMSKEVAQQDVASVWHEDQAQAIHEEAGSLFSGKQPTTGVPPVGAGSAEMQAQSEHGGEKLKPVETIRKTERAPGPNDPCPCGSGKKYKKCHGPTGGWDGPTDGTIPARQTREHKGEAKIGG
ncbi:MAG TPA: preprotein translocase subunit SecA [Planctomycetota bacterium]|nr:preprotein translocase subunit SecA [Planctomycetota bacterium]